MAGKMSGSPFHVETANYKYAVEQSEVPVAKSTFNQTITRCSSCAYYYEPSRKIHICMNTLIIKTGSHHCKGYVDCKDVPNLMQFKNEALEKYYSYRNHKLIQSLITRLKKYKPESSDLIESYRKKRWVITGSDKTYSKEDLFSLIDQMKGKYWSNLEHWDIIDSDIIIDMGKNHYKLKELNKKIKNGLYQDRQLPRIISIQEFRADIIKMIKHFTETRNCD